MSLGSRFLLTGLFVFCSSFVAGQARLTGTVKDSSGAVVPGLEVISRNIDTGQVTGSRTSPSGVYSISPLNPGQYELLRAVGL